MHSWGPAGEATDETFKARAGALTMLFVAGSESREQLLEVLDAARFGGLLRPDSGIVPSEEEIAADEEERREEADLRAALDSVELGNDVSGLRLNQVDDVEPKLVVTDKGEEFLFVARAMERWLGNRPRGPLQLGPYAAGPLAALVCCWSATVTHALAPEPQTIDELDRAIAVLDRDTIAEHVEALVRSGQAREAPGPGSARYTLTDWGREAITPIVAAVRYERRYPERDVLPPDVFDVEAAFQMALPLVSLPEDLSGACRLGVRIPEAAPLLAGASVQVERGCVISSTALLDEAPENFLTGLPLDWCEAVTEPKRPKLTWGGDRRITAGLIAALHERLFTGVELPRRRPGPDK